ncbi:unnamed protein product [Camellia sinensis]
MFHDPNSPIYTNQLTSFLKTHQELQIKEKKQSYKRNYKRNSKSVIMKKQKIVIQMQLSRDKDRSKAMQIASLRKAGEHWQNRWHMSDLQQKEKIPAVVRPPGGTPTIKGVSSVAIKGDGKDQVEVIGEQIDSVELTKSIKRKVSKYASIQSVEEVKPKEEEKKEEKPLQWTMAPPVIPTPCYCQPVYDSDPRGCSIL